MQNSPVKTSFPPWVDANTRVLLLGSLPGEKSLAAGEYYANPSNGFWWLLGEILGESELPTMPYTAKLSVLRNHRIGLWDVIESAKRRGSLDTAIREATNRDLTAFAATLPHLRAIAFNGGKAAKVGRKQLAGQEERWTLLDLPSSSGAHASMSKAAKLTLWRTIERYLR
ncbi:G/U mismatch-specific uracil-DNA glycosylase [Novosphingobium sp. PhB165]|uniref:DNA-deoxyinosine glycosylase n=1 Tax=Novosphingobium sp. PhB165 TaxID=2485105 RepID=UPI00104AFF2D|nr:DNA-deoxyinosine glycosylase [Novosphingobium sp. PhB165]TCM21403.1 G/U mismatch-specific uracil-DNA glycosylase [Novosphingobium sp. PhB165]